MTSTSLQVHTATGGTRPVPWASVALLALIAVALLLSLGVGLVNLTQGIIYLAEGDEQSSTTMLVLAGGGFARIMLLLPGAYYALMRVVNRAPWHLPTELVPTWLIAVSWTGTLALGLVVRQLDLGGPLLGPPLSGLVVLLPIWLLIRLALRGISVGSDLRRWGSFSLGTILGPLLSTIFESAFMLVLAGLALIVVLANPGLQASLLELTGRLQAAPSEQAILELIMPLILSSWFVVPAVLTLCVVTPIIEEAAKPIVVWLGAKRIASPAQGFALGALCGAGFAAFESLMAAGTAQGDWLLLLAMRAGTATMHIADSALMGWALVSAWRERRFLRLALVYGATILVHGAWNFLALAYGLTILPTALEGVPINIGVTATYALPGLIALAGFMLGVLVFMNRSLRRVPYSAHAVTRNEGLPPDSRL